MDAAHFILTLALLGLATWAFVQLRGVRSARARMQAEKDALLRSLAELEAKNALLETEQLQFQLQPHTLNNILANLRTIATKLSRGMDALSGTLEYILYKGKTHFVSVQEELLFMETYLKLNDLFLTGVDAIKLDQDEVDRSAPAYARPAIPHLITAYFIENAFKHGDRDHPEFLRVRVKLTREVFELQVDNRMKPVPGTSEGGLGLQNMKKRLELLMGSRFEMQTLGTEDSYRSLLTIRLEA